MVEILKQLQYQPMPVEQQVVSIFAATGGFLDDIPVVDVNRFQTELLEFVESRHGEIGRAVAEKGELPEDLAERLEAAIKEFRASFMPSVGGPLKEAQAKPLGRRTGGVEEVPSAHPGRVREEGRARRQERSPTAGLGIDGDGEGRGWARSSGRSGGGFGQSSRR